MNITNNANLPEPLVRAVTRDRKNRPKTISITELVQPPQIRALSLRHDSELSEDAADRIWALLGTLLHKRLEHAAADLDDHITEQELETEVLGWRVVGHFDLSYRDELLTDYKLTSVWAVKDGVKREWEEQLNLYAELLRRHDRHIQQLQIVAIGRDWSQSKAKYDSSYPQQQVKVMSVPLWTPEQANEFLEERVALHQRAQVEGIWPDCTPEERWVRDTKFAVMKTGAKKAIRLYDTNSAALTHAKDDASLYVQHRPGISVRCESYCPVSSKCPQFAKIKAEAETK